MARPGRRVLRAHPVMRARLAQLVPLAPRGRRASKASRERLAQLVQLVLLARKESRASRERLAQLVGTVRLSQAQPVRPEPQALPAHKAQRAQ